MYILKYKRLEEKNKEIIILTIETLRIQKFIEYIYHAKIYKISKITIYLL